MQGLNVSSFQDCLHNTDVPNWFLNFESRRDTLKKVAIYLGLPRLFDDDFEYIVRRSKFMVEQRTHHSTYRHLQPPLHTRSYSDALHMSSSRTHYLKIT
jgi:hypothetical protein